MKHVQGITLTHLELKLLMLNYKREYNKENKSRNTQYKYNAINKVHNKRINQQMIKKRYKYVVR